MHFAVDVHYHSEGARSAGVLFSTWEAAVAEAELTHTLDQVAAYEPGAFYKRELPCLLALIDTTSTPLKTIVIDGFVDLGAAQSPGLGRYLFEALKRAVPIIGVAKTPFKDTPAELAVRRGESQRPLWISAAGLPLADAQAAIQRMHGPYRIPTLLKRVDRLCRTSPQ